MARLYTHRANRFEVRLSDTDSDESDGDAPMPLSQQARAWAAPGGLSSKRSRNPPKLYEVAPPPATKAPRRTALQPLVNGANPPPQALKVVPPRPAAPTAALDVAAQQAADRPTDCPPALLDEATLNALGMSGNELDKLLEGDADLDFNSFEEVLPPVNEIQALTFERPTLPAHHTATFRRRSAQQQHRRHGRERRTGAAPRLNHGAVCGTGARARPNGTPPPPSPLPPPPHREHAPHGSRIAPARVPERLLRRLPFDPHDPQGPYGPHGRLPRPVFLPCRLAVAPGYGRRGPFLEHRVPVKSNLRTELKKEKKPGNKPERGSWPERGSCWVRPTAPLVEQVRAVGGF